MAVRRILSQVGDDCRFSLDMIQHAEDNQQHTMTGLSLGVVQP